MKKKLFIILAMLMATAVSYAQSPNGDESDPLPFIVKPTNPGGAHDPLPKSPVQIPEVYLDDHALTFDAAIEGCEVRLLDEYENVIFTDFIEENQTLLILPSTLTGTFELQIIRGNIIFYCEIEL